METMYFILGIGLVVVVAMAAVTVWSVLQIIKTRRTVEELERSTVDGLTQAHRDCTMVERTINNGIQHELRSIERTVDDIHRLIDEQRRYTDSRIDKLMNDPKFCLNQTTKKQLND
jgi:uncharacterized protein YoxC